MDVCILCLELWQELEERIKVESAQWLEWRIEEVIRKHIWPMNSLTSNSWLCTTCWQVLRQFHSFYERIEKAHKLFMSTELKMEHNLEDEIKMQLNTNEESLETSYTDSKHNTEEATKIFFDEIYAKEKLLPLEVKLEMCGKNLREEVALPLKRSSRLKKIGDPLEKDKPRNTRINKRNKTNKCIKPDKKTNKKSKAKTKLIEEVVQEQTYAEEQNNESCSDNHTDSFQSSDDIKLPHKTSTEHKEHDTFVAENFKIICGICQIPMSTFYEVSAHSAKEHKQRGYVKCCNKKFYRRIILVEHIRWHLDPERFKCKECGKVLADRRCLQVHERLHEQQERNHICDICGKGFARPVTLQRHKYTHIPDEDRREPCDQCDKKYATKDLLMKHIHSVHLHSYSVVCDICGKEIRSKAVFQRHMLQHAGLQTTVSCDICGLKLSDKRRLKVHKQTQHSQEARKEYKCHICSKISASREALKQHVQYNHETGYDFKCTVCDKAFKRACTLKEHMATHTGSVLYTCPYCPKTFNSNANMYTHRKKVHPQKWEEAFREKYSGNLPPKLQRTLAAEGENTSHSEAMAVA